MPLEAITVLLFVRLQRFNFFGCSCPVIQDELLQRLGLIAMVEGVERRVFYENHPLAELCAKVIDNFPLLSARRLSTLIAFHQVDKTIRIALEVVELFDGTKL